MASSTCVYTADYSLLTGDKIFPYVVTLNLERSVLNPAAGSYQTFCYDVVGVGKGTEEDTAFTNFLLGICPGITRTDIEEVTVAINGEKQTVIWGENVVLRSVDDPDPLTGHAGLKFNFPLDPVYGEMEITISLVETYEVGAVDVCLYGSGTGETGLSVCGPVCGDGASCESVVYQNETICVPVTVTPFAKPGTAKTTCCGIPVINEDVACTGNATSCSFSISQNLCIAIPVSFGAAVKTGTAVVQCGGSSEAGCNCSETE
jgi:hypothetical protein